MNANPKVVSKMLIPGGGHVAACYDALQRELAARGEGNWQAVTIPTYLHRLHQAAAYLEQLYPGPKLVVCHSLGGAIAAHLAVLGSVRGICALAPVAQGLGGSLKAARAALRYLGLRQGLMMLFGGGAFPLAERKVGRLLYADDTPPAEQERRLSLLRREADGQRLGDGLLPKRTAPAGMHNLVLDCQADRICGTQWSAAYARWAHADLRTVPGPHNAFEDKNSASIIADHILHWCRQAEQGGGHLTPT